MRYLPGEAPGHQGTIPTRCRRAHTAPSRSDSEDDAAVHDPESTTLNVSLVDTVRESDAPGNAKDDHADYEELDEEARSDEEQDEEQVVQSRGL